MTTTRILTTALLCAVMLSSCTDAPAPYGALPTPYQVEWQKMETNMFVHFGPNTFTGVEWGHGDESVDIFQPTELDCRQWAAVAKAAGMKGVIITAKHHDGFCLWPNPYSQHTVAQSSWRDGKGDILKELSEACREAGLKFGIYISPWDRNDPHYGTDEYNNVFVGTLESALGSYGDVFEQWFDGACGEGPNGKRQVYNWPLYHKTVYGLHENAVIFSDVGPGCRWVGNEYGSAGRTNWGTLDTAGFAPGKSPALDTLNCGNVHGQAWIPAETDVSIRPGWFYRESEDSQVKSLADLLSIYYNSVGRNSLLLLNVPADTRGLIPAVDSLRLLEFRAALDEIFAVDLAKGAKVEASNERGCRYAAANLLDGDYDSYWATEDGVTTASVTLTLPEARTFNMVQIQEYIPLGQRIAEFRIEVRDAEGNWKEAASETTIGYKRMVHIDRVTTDAVRLVIDRSYAEVVLNGISLYDDRIFMEAPKAVRDKQGNVSMTVGEGDIYYTLDGSRPSAESSKYEGPFTVAGKCHVAAIAISGDRTSEVAHYHWDIAPRDFRVVSPAGADAAIDGLSDDGANHGTVIPAGESLVIDLGSNHPVRGFFYEPLSKGRNGTLIDYNLSVSKDGKSWETVCENATFDNIVNNPIRRTQHFPGSISVRYIRLEPVRCQNSEHYGVGEFGILTDY